MLRMASAFGGAPSPFGAGGYGGYGSPFGAPRSAFPAPGTPNTNPANPADSTSPTTATPPTSAPSPGSPPLNPALSPFLFGAPPAAAGGYNPALMQQMLAASHAMGQGANAAGGWGGFGGAGYGMGTPPVPSDTRPPEERFQVQLQVSLFYPLYFILFCSFIICILTLLFLSFSVD